MLGMLESMDDDESYVESTLARLEYPTSTSSAASLLNDIVNTTAPYHPTPKWKIVWKQWSKKVLPMLVMPNTRQIFKYAPWMAVMIVYIGCRLAWYVPPPTAVTDTERMTLRAHSDTSSRLRGGLPSTLPQQPLLQDSPYYPSTDTDQSVTVTTRPLPPLQATKLAPLYDFDNEKPKDGDSMRHAKPEEDATNDSAASQPPAPDSKLIQSSIPKTPNDTTSIAFQERVQKLKDLRDRGHISIASGSGPVSQFLSKQEQQNNEKARERKEIPKDERSLEIKPTSLEQKQEHEHHVNHERSTQKQSQQQTNPRVQPQQQDQKSDSEQQNVESTVQARKPGEKYDAPSGLISLDLV